jgi:hypothetical protein
MSRRCLPILSLLLTGCGADPGDWAPWNETEKQANQTSTTFNPARTGQVSGQVSWSGKFPSVPPIGYTVAKADASGFENRITANPNRPKINAATRAITDAVVFLRKIDPAASRPWDLPPVKVTIGYGEINIAQGSHQGRTGFVRRGDKVEIVSIESAFHILRCRGDDFFGITFPVPEDPVTRILKQTGRIELSSGTGLSWMRADLFVSDHPYYTRTDSNGRFSFDLVPVGEAELVVWLPNWEAGRPIHEPESSILARPTYAPPLERVNAIKVERGNAAKMDISLP